MSARVNFNIGPQDMDVDGCKVTILEVTQSRVLDATLYHVTVMISCRGVVTRPFTIDARNAMEFRAKLLVEISKLRMLIRLHGVNVAQWVAGG